MPKGWTGANPTTTHTDRSVWPSVAWKLLWKLVFCWSAADPENSALLGAARREEAGQGEHMRLCDPPKPQGRGRRQPRMGNRGTRRQQGAEKE